MARFPKRLALVLSFLTGIGSTLGCQKIFTNLETEASKLGEKVTCMIQEVSPHSGLEGIKQPFATVQFHSDLGKNETKFVPTWAGTLPYYQTGNPTLYNVCNQIRNYPSETHRVFPNPVK